MTTPIHRQHSFNYKKNTLHCDQVSITKLAKHYGTPLYIYSQQSILENLNNLQKAFKKIKPQICFAVKANSNLHILSFLSKQGVGFDLVSQGEMKRALLAGGDPSTMVFSGVGKTIEEMTFALKCGVGSFHIESYEELKTLGALAKKLKIKTSVSLRFNPNVNPKTHPYISTGLKKNKFGIEEKEIYLCSSYILKTPHLSLHGLSVHIGSQILSLKPFEETFIKLKKTGEALLRLGHPITFYDLGGGIGIQYDKESPIHLQNYAKLVEKIFYNPSLSPSQQPKIILEPGRSLVGNAGILVTTVLYRKKKQKRDYLIVDAGMNDLMRPALYQSHHDIICVQKTSSKNLLTQIVGPVCESSDVLGFDRSLPASLKQGDLLCILSAGAYGMSMSSQYNTRLRPAEVLVLQSKHQLIRRRDTFEDLVFQELDLKGKHQL
jgi:diaminopimelate decarboxylase